MTTVATPRLTPRFMGPLLTGLVVGGGSVGLLGQVRSATALGPAPDAQSYAYQALQIAAGNLFTIPAVGEVGQSPTAVGMFPSRYPPGFSLILSLAGLVRPGSLNAILLGSAMVSVALLVAVALVTARIFGWWAALIASLGVLATPFIWHSATIVMSDAFGGLLAVIVTWVTWEALRRAPGSTASRWWLVALGFALGFAVFSRLALLVLVVAAVLAIRRWRALLIVVASAAPWALILALYQWRAYGSPLETGYDYWLPGLQEFSLASPLAINPPGDGPYIYPDIFNGALFQWACPCTSPAISYTPPILTYPSSLLGLYWVIAPPLLGIAGIAWMWIHRTERFAHFVGGLVVVNLLFFIFYFDQGVRFMAPASFPLIIVSAAGVVGAIRRLRSGIALRSWPSPRVAARSVVRSVPRNRLQLAWLALPMVAAFAYVVVRAATISVTHDESISYGTVHGNPEFADDANNHWLNTLLMHVSEHLFGSSLFAIRLPNVIAFVFFAVAVMYLLWSRKAPAQAVGIGLLIANPFLLEYFSLARGYGLSMAFIAIALAAISRFDHVVIRSVVVVVAVSLAFYSNFSVLNVVLGVLGAVALTHVLRRAWSALAILALSAAALLPGVVYVKHLQDAGKLYAGGTRGLFPDTIGSLISLSGNIPGDSVLVVVWTGAVVAIVLFCLTVAVCQRRWTSLAAVAAVLLIAVAAQLTESSIFKTLWAEDRSALSYAVVFGALVVLGVSELPFRWSVIPASLASLALVANFLSQANVSYTTLWRYDQSSGKVMADVRALEARIGPPTKPWVLLAGFPRSQALDFYRISDRMAYIAPLTRDPVTGVGDIFYVDATEPMVPGTTTIASFPETGTQLRVSAEIAAELRSRAISVTSH